ncbi:MAG: hypothetical protein QUS66_01760 [Bacteroidota bacterium]|nr:hypothetical protein [Bacteroidota bacterium]
MILIIALMALECENHNSCDTMKYLVVAGISSVPIVPLEGKLDYSYGADGAAYVNSKSETEAEIGHEEYTYISDIVLDENDNMYAVGHYRHFDSSAGYYSYYLILFKISPNGNIDTTFGDCGSVRVEGGDTGYTRRPYACSITIDKKGRIVIVYADACGSTKDLVIRCYYLNGQPCHSFGDLGMAMWSGFVGAAGYGMYGRTRISTDRAGCLYVSGSMGRCSDGGIWTDNNIIIIKYRGDGTLDPDFGSGGCVVLDGMAGELGKFDAPASMKIDAFGRPVLSGYSVSGGTLKLFVTRLLANGVIDRTFGVDGAIIKDSASYITTSDMGEVALYDLGSDVVLDNEGNIVVASTIGSLGNYDLAVWKFTGTGKPYQGFGGNGAVLHDDYAGLIRSCIRPYCPVVQDYAGAVAIDEKNRIIVGGCGKGYMTITRFLPNGVVDRNFGSDGGFYLHTDAHQFTLSLIMQFDSVGRILAGGDANPIWRIK